MVCDIWWDMGNMARVYGNRHKMGMIELMEIWK